MKKKALILTAVMMMSAPSAVLAQGQKTEKSESYYSKVIQPKLKYIPIVGWLGYGLGTVAGYAATKSDMDRMAKQKEINSTIDRNLRVMRTLNLSEHSDFSRKYRKSFSIADEGKRMDIQAAIADSSSEIVNGRIALLEIQRDNLESEIRGMESEIELAKSSAESAVSSLEGMDGVNQKLIDDAKAEIESIQESYEEKIMSVRTQKREKDLSAQGKKVAKRKQLEAVQARLDKAVKALEGSEANLAIYEGYLLKESKRVRESAIEAGLGEELAELEAQDVYTENRKERVAERRSKVDSATKAVEKLQRDLAKAEKKDTATIERLTKQAEALELEISGLTEDSATEVAKAKAVLDALVEVGSVEGIEKERVNSELINFSEIERKISVKKDELSRVEAIIDSLK